MSKTNQGLAEYAKKALAEKWGYVLGSFGNTATRAFLNAKYAQSGGVGTYNSKNMAYIETFLNKRVSDCYGVVKGYIWTEGNGEPKYAAGQDRNQEGAFSAAREKGVLSTLPEIPGIVLWMKGHAGVYIGGGEFIECRGCPVGMAKGTIKNGVVTSGSRFTHWFKDTYIEYLPVKDPVKEETELKSEMKFTVNGGTVLKVESILSSDSNYPKLRPLMEALGIRVDYDTSTGIVKLTK